MPRRRYGIVVALACAACGPPPAPARLSAADPPMPRELQAAERYRTRRCNPNWKFLYPGLGQICLREDAAGAAVMAAETADVAASIAVYAEGGDPLLPLAFLQDAYLYGITAPAIERQVASGMRFAPQDSFGELVVAPLNGRVMLRPEVLGGLAGMTAAGVAVSYLLLDRGTVYHPRATPRIYGVDLPRSEAYPLAGGIYAVGFAEVAIAEESLFRGYFQSGFARRCGETCGVVAGGWLFGLAHAPNALLLEGEDQARYLGLGVPLLVLDGMLLGAIYRHDRYSLAPTVAIHFWYDLVVSLIDYGQNPRKSEISGHISLPL